MIEISTDPDGTVTTEVGLGVREEWGRVPDLPKPDERGDYDDGFRDGVEAAAEAAADAAPRPARRATTAGAR